MRGRPRLYVRLLLGVAFVPLMVAAFVLSVSSVEVPLTPEALPLHIATIALVDLRTGGPDQELDLWAKAAWELGLATVRLSGLNVENELPAYDAIVLADAERVSKEEWAQLERFLLKGRGVIVTGFVGMRDAEGRTHEIPLLERLFPGQRFQEVNGQRTR